MRRPLQSVRARILLLYVFVLLLTLSFFGVTTYVYFERSLWHKIDSLIELRAKGVETSIRTYLKTEEYKSGGWEGFVRLFRQKSDGFAPIAEFLTGPEAASATAEELKMGVDIFDPTGKPIASTDRDLTKFMIPAGTLKVAREGQARYYPLRLRMLSGKPLMMRAMVWPLLEGSRVEYLIQVRVPLSPVRAELSGLSRILLTSVAVTLLVASWASLIFVLLTLRPVDRIVRAIRGVRADNLSVRVQVPRTNDEIQRLAETFNDLLARLEKSFTAQKQIVQDISHELKTPLTVLRGQIEIALKHDRTVREYRDVFEANLVEIERIRRIIHGLLMLAKLDSDRVGLQLGRVDLREIAASTLEDVKMLAGARRIDFHLECPGALSVRGDAVYLKRLLSNLIENAFKYTPEGGRIDLEVAARPDGAQIRVRDTGVGIDPADLPHVFERFYRARNRKNRDDSFGLGLSIVRSIVELHRGRIQVESRQGTGTEFIVTLPFD